MKPQDLPELRSQVVAAFQKENDDTAAAAVAPREITKDDDDPRLIETAKQYNEATTELAKATAAKRDTTWGQPELLAHWRMAELFFVTGEMTELAAVSEKTMPGFELHRDDLPAEIGLIYFNTMALYDDMSFDVVALWGPDWVHNTGGLLITIYGRKPEDLTRVFSMQIGYGEDQIESDFPDARVWARVTRCAWLLMQQRIATTTDYLPDRASARRLARLGKPVTPVRVISLRQPEAHATGDHSRSYHHRWVVRGHWRKQWYASQERNVPIWISPYVKGPDGAPLLAGEKVYAWTR